MIGMIGTINLKELFASTARRLKNSGCNSSPAEIENIWRLACEETKVNSRNLLINQKNTLRTFEFLLALRRQRVPFQLLEGRVVFVDIPLKVRPGVFIPRPETEEVAVYSLKLAKKLQGKMKRSLSILDVGTGTGALALYLAKHLIHSKVTAIDISERAVELTNENARLLGLVNVMVYRRSFSEQTKLEEKFDLVVSNPPYVSEGERFFLPLEVTEWEPEEALFAGNDGFELYREIASQISRVLRSRGSFLLEFGYNQAQSIYEIFEKNNFVIRIHKDMNGKERFLEGKIRVPK